MDPGNPEAKGRRFTFTSEGSGNVKVVVAGVEAGQKVTLCLAFPGREPFCQTASKTTLLGRTTRAKTNWTVTLKGATSGMVTRADLTITFPSSRPAITAEDMYLAGGQTYPGIVIRVTPRKSCAIGLSVMSDPPVAADIATTDLTEPGATAPAPAADCAAPPDGAMAIDAMKGHKYEIGITSSSPEESHAKVVLTWP